MSRKVRSSDILFRLFEDSWETWEMGALPRKLEGAAGADAPRILAVPARQVIATPLWIDGTDSVLVAEAARLELDIRGLVPRAPGMDAIVVRTFPDETRTLVVAAVFPTETPAEFPEAERFDASPFLMSLAPDAITLWREGEDLVAAVCRGRQVVYWETNDRASDAGAIRAWLDLIILRLRGEGIITESLRFANGVEGFPADRVFPAGCDGAPLSLDAAGCAPSLTGARFEWRPEPVIRAERQRARKAQTRKIVMAVAAGYLVVALCFGIYFGFLKIRASLLTAEAAKLAAGVEKFQPIASEWTSLLGRTADPGGYPLEILSAVVSAMPPEGIRLTEFGIEDTKVRVAGEADSFNIANDYLNKVAENDATVVWTKTTPVPVGNTTRFAIEGVIQPSSFGGPISDQ